ncbi:unnamed protein product [Owenia fusiformis]|uniref:Uncharacterized protein n=1 Tax=Owenia fusiformis TaxID=6347 RepID=A0A8J1XK83_OWEFU|nr:unnamed protein product [Owenia fusiformis]
MKLKLILGLLLVSLVQVKTNAKLCEGGFNIRTMTKDQCKQCENRRWISSKGSCQTCISCLPGWGLSQACGNGNGNDIRIECILCNHTNHRYSDKHDTKQCKRSPQCHTFNRVYNKTATPTSRAVCGPCKNGYFIPSSMNFFPGTLRACDDCALAMSKKDKEACALATEHANDETSETNVSDIIADFGGAIIERNNTSKSNNTVRGPSRKSLLGDVSLTVVAPIIVAAIIAIVIDQVFFHRYCRRRVNECTEILNNSKSDADVSKDANVTLPLSPPDNEPLFTHEDDSLGHTRKVSVQEQIMKGQYTKIPDVDFGADFKDKNRERNIEQLQTAGGDDQVHLDHRTAAATYNRLDAGNEGGDIGKNCDADNMKSPTNGSGDPVHNNAVNSDGIMGIQTGKIIKKDRVTPMETAGFKYITVMNAAEDASNYDKAIKMLNDLPPSSVPSISHLPSGIRSTVCQMLNKDSSYKDLGWSFYPKDGHNYYKFDVANMPNKCEDLLDRLITEKNVDILELLKHINDIERTDARDCLAKFIINNPPKLRS